MRGLLQRLGFAWPVLLAGFSSGPGSAPAFAQAIQAGAAARALALPAGVPLAGYSARRTLPDVLDSAPYAHDFAPSQGQRDPVRVKALLLRRGSQELLFLSVDLVGVTSDLRQSLLGEIGPLGQGAEGFGPDEVFVSATHTHSGPGALSTNEFYENLATDRFHPAVHQVFLTAVKSAVSAAVADLRAAELFAWEFQAQGLQRNRRRADQPDHVDHAAAVLAARDTGGGHHWIGGMANLAVHGTSLGAGNLKLSADLPGALELELGARLRDQTLNPAEVPILFLNGAEGDVAPLQGGEAWMQSLAEGFANQAMLALGTSSPLTGPWQVETDLVKLGVPFSYFAPHASPPLNVLPGWTQLGIELGEFLPETVRIWSIGLGDLRLMTWPGEPTTDLGLELRSKAAALGLRPWLVALTNEHVGYFTSATDQDHGGYESQASFYGRHGGRHVLDAHLCLLR